MDQSKIDRADELASEAAALRAQAFTERPLPKKWAKGQKVRYIRDSSGGWSFTRGGLGVIHRIDPRTKDRLASEYVLFWTHPLDPNGEPNKGISWWTTSDDVELVI